ncbi:hypothetical protein [Clostridium sp. LIBA-8841]|uniref:hypothetical protein n=1 Tax=Clostridium sp. LIBA-8841 TaxID=2987530 RepID=UPI002AC5B479|nr:hypothetical protein [Clostridium sp. LIBA-8841]MDZ5252987.1 hypothetical protein [Clostridium sp. LIBA-8841]
MLQANKRDVRVKCRKFRNAGKATGVINRKNGENISVSLKISDLDKFLAKYGDHSNVDINLEGEIIKTSIIEVQRDLLIHNAININLREI